MRIPIPFFLAAGILACPTAPAGAIGSAVTLELRTDRDKVNRFYFTTVEDSYAAAFGDTSAMGVVAMAVYPEAFPFPPAPSRPGIRRAPCEDGSLGSLLPEPVHKAKRLEAQGAAGTGYGEEVYSPSVTVEFQPEAQPWEKTFIKYEWRETLLRLGVIRNPAVPRNRLWDQGYAPPPPRS